VAEDEGKRMARRHAIEGKSNVRVTDSAAGNFDDHFFRTGYERGEFAPLQRAFGRLQLEAVSPLNARQR